jgi:hypothetical protein
MAASQVGLGSGRRKMALPFRPACDYCLGIKLATDIERRFFIFSRGVQSFAGFLQFHCGFFPQLRPSQSNPS